MSACFHFHAADQILPPWVWENQNRIHPPESLYLECHESALSLFERLPEQGLGVVGTRSPQPRSREITRQEIRRLRGRPFIIVSGMARGIDTAAHWAAIEAGLPTIAVLGCGLGRVYPEENAELKRRIIESGGIIASEFAPGDPPRPGHFIQRNRLIAAWSKAIWVVQAPARSGSLNTAKWARELDRTCYATPCFPGDAEFEGNKQLIDERNAHCFWGISSLGPSWLELATVGQHISRRRQLSSLSPDDEILAFEVGQRTLQQGGCQVSEVLDWAIGNSWEPRRFFLALQIALANGLIADQMGVLVGRAR